MNNKGFTLIELIATIALLAIIAVIAFVSIGKVIEHSKVTNCNSLVESIEKAAMEYVSDHRYDSSFISSVNTSDMSYSMTAAMLVNGHYINGELINPFTKESIATNTVQLTIYLNDDYTVKSVQIVDPVVLKTCTPNNGG